MGLFRKKQPAPIAETGYDDVVEYLRDLEQTDYTKILKVVSTYREADKKVKKILGILADDLFSDDTELGNFLADEPVVPKKPKAKKAAKK